MDLNRLKHLAGAPIRQAQKITEEVETSIPTMTFKNADEMSEFHRILEDRIQHNITLSEGIEAEDDIKAMYLTRGPNIVDLNRVQLMTYVDPEKNVYFRDPTDKTNLSKSWLCMEEVKEFMQK